MRKFVLSFYLIVVLCFFASGQYDEEEQAEPENEEEKAEPATITIGEPIFLARNDENWRKMNKNEEKWRKKKRYYWEKMSRSVKTCGRYKENVNGLKKNEKKSREAKWTARIWIWPNFRNNNKKTCEISFI